MQPHSMDGNPKREQHQLPSVYTGNTNALIPVPSSIVSVLEPAQHHQPLNHPTAAASVNAQSTFTDQTLPVSLTYTLTESKRLVLAFESRIQSEITWALNTLLILSCNTNQNFTLETQPYLVESISSYLQYCIENVETFDLTTDCVKKDAKLNITQVQSYKDIFQPTQDEKLKLSYRHFGMFSR